MQRWLDNQATNHGLIVLGDEANTNNAKRFGSRTNPNADERPALVVAYRCPADFNGDGFVDIFDFDHFVAAFESVC